LPDRIGPRTRESALKGCTVILIPLIPIMWVVKKLRARRQQNLRARQQVQSQ